MHRSIFVAIFSICALVGMTCLMPITMAKDMPSMEMSMQGMSSDCLDHCLSHAKSLSNLPSVSPFPEPCPSVGSFCVSFLSPSPFDPDLLFVPAYPPPLAFPLATIVLRQ
ncbi:hypothetical protein A2635_01690 [Candidatus Peribacteria bacterium RIFCSPHIGHO2_01_FULL_51_9]|nr:MAG: hypothetical protein A2635_01690 [Candidatus Peribacteria bacterium RIFCSPHIGHO2_01_FULL_51_9]